MNERRMPGPASWAPCPVATKMPVPTTEPMPSAAKSMAVKFFLSWVWSAASWIWAGVFVFQMFMQNLALGGTKRGIISQSGRKATPSTARVRFDLLRGGVLFKTG